MAQEDSSQREAIFHKMCAVAFVVVADQSTGCCEPVNRFEIDLVDGMMMMWREEDSSEQEPSFVK